MKRFILSICLALSLIALGSVPSQAIILTGNYTDTVDFYKSGSYDGRSYELIRDSPDFSYTHSVNFAYPAIDVTSAFLKLTYADVSHSGEVWVVQGGSSKTYIGTLDSTYGGWDTETFTVPYSLYSSVAGSTWNLLITFDETTSGTDTFKLDKSELYGCYTYDPNPGTVPEPATMLLLGTGMIGLLGSRKRFKKA